MRTPTPLHDWNLFPKQAIALQRDLARRVRESALKGLPRLVAGGDCAFAADGKEIIAAWVVWDRPTREIVDQSIERRPVNFPYIPGLLSFREAPALLAAAARLRVRPNLFMLDGHGRAHPRRIGIACHVGLWLDRPTIGVAKSRLCGDHREPATRRGSSVRLMHEGEVIGRVVRTADNVRPVYVSVGHRTTLTDAVRVASACSAGYRLPEPTRAADRLVARVKRGEA